MKKIYAIIFVLVAIIFFAQGVKATECYSNWGCNLGVCINGTCSSTTVCTSDSDCPSGQYCISQFCSGSANTGFPVINLSAIVVSAGGYNLAWSVTDATSCTAFSSPSISSWNGSQQISGAQTISGLTSNTILTLTCTGQAGTKSKSITVPASGGTSCSSSVSCQLGYVCVNGTCSSSSSSKTITVTSPNGGEKWEMGKTYDIVWTSAGVDKVNISIEFGGSGGVGIVTTGIQASLGKYSWKVDVTNSNNSLNKIIVADASDSNILDKSNDYFTILPAGSSVSVSGCDSSSFSSTASAFDFQSGGNKTNLCGASQQYFKATIPTGRTCDIKWTLTPDSSSDYDLYVKNDASLTRNVYDSRATNGKGLADEITKTGLSAGTYYAMVNKEPGTGSYSIAVSFLNCSGSTSTTNYCYGTTICSTGTSCVNGSCVSSTSQSTNCDTSSFLQAGSAFDFQSGGNKTNLCGESQYFKAVVPSGKTCDLKWTLTPDSGSDYDLYIKNDSSLTRNVYSSRSTNGKGLADEILQSGLSAGTYYAMAYKEGGTTGSYSITVAQVNCSGSSTTTNTNTNTNTNTDMQAQIAQLQAQINQLLAQIAKLQSDLSKVNSSQGTNTSNWCYTFTKKLKYMDSGWEVGALQAALKKEGLLNINRLTTYFGQLTQQALVSFQNKYKSEILLPTGLSNGMGAVDDATIIKLNQLYGCK